MIGIVSYGGYIPRLRLDRMSIYQQIGWLAPAVVMVAQGERSVCNWDEDSLTMAVAASRDCLAGMDKRQVDALYLASTTLPFADRLNAGIVATALNLREDIVTADFGSSPQRPAPRPSSAALEAVSRTARPSWSRPRTGARPRPARSTRCGTATARPRCLLGSEDVIAEFKGSYSVSYDFVSHYRAAEQRFDYTWEERWVRDEGYAKIIPEAINGLLDQAGHDHRRRGHGWSTPALSSGSTPASPAPSARPGTGGRQSARGLRRDRRRPSAGHARPRAGGGQARATASWSPVSVRAATRSCFEVTEQIAALAPTERASAAAWKTGQTTDNYLKYLKFRDLIETETGIRAEAPDQTAMTTLWRKRKMILGLVGGRCTVCGTPQYPQDGHLRQPRLRRSTLRRRITSSPNVPPRSRALPATCWLCSVDPPAIYGMVQFEGGGRLHGRLHRLRDERRLRSACPSRWPSAATMWTRSAALPATSGKRCPSSGRGWYRGDARSKPGRRDPL